MKRLRVLLSAYACEPDKGSEPGVGWSVAQEMAAYHDVWVLTRANNRSAITAALDGAPISRARFVHYDLPPWARWWKRGERGIRLYYYLWQVGAYFVARKLHGEVDFDLVHHVTVGKHWAPSFLVLLPVPFVWGPVGGAESAPRAFLRNFGSRGRAYERLRGVARWIGEHDPFVRLTAHRSALALAKTEETAERLRTLGAETVRVLSEAGLPADKMHRLAQCSISNDARITFIGIGRLLCWKGFHLGLRAFARASIEGAEYWIVGDGPERKTLENLAQELGLAGRIRFWGRLSHRETLRKLEEAHVLVHPSLHDSGGWVCVEAMAAGRPVICLDLGGPATQVTSEAGVKVKAHGPEQAVRHLADAMRRLAQDSELRQAMGRAGRRCSQETYSWKGKGKLLDAIYVDVVRGVSGHAGHPTYSRARECSPR